MGEGNKRQTQNFEVILKRLWNTAVILWHQNLSSFMGLNLWNVRLLTGFFAATKSGLPAAKEKKHI